MFSNHASAVLVRRLASKKKQNIFKKSTFWSTSGQKKTTKKANFDQLQVKKTSKKIAYFDQIWAKNPIFSSCKSKNTIFLY